MGTGETWAGLTDLGELLSNVSPEHNFPVAGGRGGVPQLVGQGGAAVRMSCLVGISELL